jgi:hypothetical protein
MSRKAASSWNFCSIDKRWLVICCFAFPITYWILIAVCCSVIGTVLSSSCFPGSMARHSSASEQAEGGAGAVSDA